MAFEQATIKIEKVKEFGELKAAIARAFAPENVEKYLKKMASAGLRIRDFDSVLAKQVLDEMNATPGGRVSKKTMLAASDVAREASEMPTG